MKNLPAAISILVLSLAVALVYPGEGAMLVWTSSFACFLLLVALVEIDSRNLFSLKVLRWFPMIVAAFYLSAVTINTLVLQRDLDFYVALYLAALCVGLADYAGQLIVGEDFVLLLGRNHLGRPGHHRRGPGEFFY